MTSLHSSSTAQSTVVNLTADWRQLQPAWDEFVEQHPKGSIFHSSAMMRVFAAARRHAVLPLAAVDRDGSVLALLAAVRVRTLPNPLGPMSSRSIWYAEPLCRDDPESIDALAALIAAHDQLMRRHVLFTEVRPLGPPGPERIALERCGYEFYDYLNYVVDLTQGTERLWTNMGKSCRRSIRRGEKRGFQWRELAHEDGVSVLYRFLERTYGRAQVPLADRSLFDAAFRELQPRGALRCFAVFDGDAPVAIDTLLAFKGRLFAWYGGCERMTGVSPMDYLQWHEFVRGLDEGYALYDFGGAGQPDEPYGVRDFKAKFGGELVCYGRYRKVYSPWKMAMAERAYQWGRSVMSPK
jgi:CelD/BcsL family acetyltransferase involved in cellulose biosynthesis